MARLFLQKSPSQATDGYWVYAERKVGRYPKPTFRSGKWLVFVSAYAIDRIWAKIKTATEEGKLGGAAKAATAKPNSYSQNSNSKVICVYTYDWEDERDVKRIREELKKIGITRKIAYKADEDTEQGRYRTNSKERLSKYYE